MLGPASTWLRRGLYSLYEPVLFERGYERLVGGFEGVIGKLRRASVHGVNYGAGVKLVTKLQGFTPPDKLRAPHEKRSPRASSIMLGGEVDDLAVLTLVAVLQADLAVELGLVRGTGLGELLKEEEALAGDQENARLADL